MKLLAFCPECLGFPKAVQGIEAGTFGVIRSWGAGEGDLPFLDVDLIDDTYYETVCLKGHRSSFVLDSPKFAMLFESGALALLDSYYREAVSSFAAAVERFYQYWTWAVCFDRGVAVEALEKAWSCVANQSERQLGAFIFLHLCVNGECPPLLPNKLVEFRNRVIHKGALPSREEAMAYGDAVLKHMVVLYDSLYEGHHTGLVGLNRALLAHGIGRSKVPDPFHLSPTTIFSICVKGGVGHGESLAGLRDINPVLRAEREAGGVSFQTALSDLQGRREALRATARD